MEIKAITERVIAAALRVHTYFGPGLFENVYKDASTENCKNGFTGERSSASPR